MSTTTTIGGNRIGGGKKMQTSIKEYGHSVHNLSYVWRNTQAVGTIVPFLCIPGINHDNFKIRINPLVRTHPTVGPLFGSFKMQYNIFKTRMGLYNRRLHNNPSNVGLAMKTIYLPIMSIKGSLIDKTQSSPNQQQISASSLLAYTGTRGLGTQGPTHQAVNITRKVMAIPVLNYWEIVKNNYANLQEGVMKIITAANDATVATITSVRGWSAPNAGGVGVDLTERLVNQAGATASAIALGAVEKGYIIITGSNLTLDSISVCIGSSNSTAPSGRMLLSDESMPTYYLCTTNPGRTTITMQQVSSNSYWWTGVPENVSALTPAVSLNYGNYHIGEFPVEDIDDIREAILGAPTEEAYDLATDSTINSKGWIPTITGTYTKKNGVAETGSFNEWAMNGLALACYASDRFNNWLNTDWIDGDNGVNAMTAINVEDGKWILNDYNVAKAIYNVTNRIVVMGNTFQGWQVANWGGYAPDDNETPRFIGGGSFDINFNEVVSTAAINIGDQISPLGTLGGRGYSRDANHNSFTVGIETPSWIMGLCHISPRIDYSQGNKWWTRLETLEDLHKPEFDGIGFQELLTEEMCAWTTMVDDDGTLLRQSIGKQPAWIEYTTNENENYGNFANKGSESFMVLNRNYTPEFGTTETTIADATTYIDPTKYTGIFATQALSDMHFWVELAIEVEANRAMSNVLIPTL